MLFAAKALLSPRALSRNRHVTGVLRGLGSSGNGSTTNNSLGEASKDARATKVAGIRERRRRLVQDEADLNPFVASMMHSGGSVGPAEAAMRKYIKEGGLEDLEGSGKPLPDRAEPLPHVDRTEHQLDGIVNRMLQEKDDTDDGEWRRAVAKSGIADLKALKEKEQAGGYFGKRR